MGTIVFTNTLEGGTDEANVTAANSGGASGNAFASPSLSTATIKYDTARPAHGSMSMRFDSNGSTSTEYIPADFTDDPDVLVSFYFQIDALPAATANFVSFESTSSFHATLKLESDGDVVVFDDANTFLGQVGPNLAADTLYRIEFMVQVDTTTTGVIEVRLYEGDSTTALGTFSTSTANCGTNPISKVRFGQQAGVALGTAWYDSIQIVTGAVSGDMPLVYAADTTDPVISNLAYDQVSDTSVRITWTTDENATATVDYGTATATYTDQEPDPDDTTATTTSHSVTLTGLTADTLYYARVRSEDASANEAISSEFTFRTAVAGSGAASVQFWDGTAWVS